MISLQKIGDSAVKFVFTDSDHYLYGNGEIEVPVNSLLLVIDESDMVTFKKLSGDPFLSFRADNSNLGTKAAIEQFYKDNMVGSTGGGSGSGVTPSEVQEMIDESISGKADTSDVTAVASDVSTLSGQVATKVATSDFNAYSAATDARIAEDEEVTAAALNDLNDNKQGKLVYYSEDTEGEWAGIDIQGNGDGVSSEYWLNVGGGSTDFGTWNETDDGEGNVASNNVNVSAGIDNLELSVGSEDDRGMNSTNLFVQSTGATMEYNKATGDEITDAHTFISIEEGLVAAEVYADEETTRVNIYPSGVTINGENVLTDGIITSAITSGSTDDEIPTAKAVYDATQSGGGGATYSAGTNISIDTANTINCTLNLRNGTQANSLTGVQGETKAKNSFAFGNGSTAGTSTNDDYAFAFGFSCKARKGRSFAYGSYQDVKEIDSAAFGQHITLNAPRSFGAGYYNVTNNWGNAVFGEYITTNNRDEFATGTYNNSVTGSTASGQTLFSVGNGTADNARHNAFEIRQNGDIYVNDGTNDVRLQDTILALGGLKFAQVTQAQYDALVSGGTVDSSTIYFITNVVS